MLTLGGSLLALLLGAWLYRWLHDQPRATHLFDGFMYVAVPVLVVWQVIPHAWSEHGVMAIALLLVGAGAPLVVERMSLSLAPHTDNMALIIGLSGLAVHAMLEGAALVPQRANVTAAVLLHRILVGLMMWWLLLPRHGILVASLGLATIAIATVAGYGLGSQFLFDGGVHLYQAFVGGSLLHVVFHQSRHDHRHDQD